MERCKRFAGELDAEFERVGVGAPQFEHYPPAASGKDPPPFVVKGTVKVPHKVLTNTELDRRIPTHAGSVAPKCDNVKLPQHYARFPIEPVRFIGENKLNFFQGNIVKYTLRHDAKNGIEDIRKVQRYARMYELFLMGNPDWWSEDPADQARRLANDKVFAAMRANVESVEDPDTRAALLKGINVIEAEHRAWTEANANGPA